MQSTRWAGARLLSIGLLALLILAPSVQGDERALSGKEIKARLRALKSVSNRWFATRKRFPNTCPLCQGRGRIIQNVRGRPTQRKCPQCKGKKLWVSDKHFKKCYYDMRSTAYQDMPGVRDYLGNVYKLARAGTPWPRRFQRVRLRRVEMIDAAHGIAYHLLDADRAPTETRWVYVATGKRGLWCLWHEKADGAWPAERLPLEPAGPRRTGDTWTDLSPEEHKAARAAVSAAHLSWRSFELRRRGGELRVRLMPIDSKRVETAEQIVGPNAARLACSLFRSSDAWSRVRLDWEVEWKDGYDHLVSRPLWISRLTKQTYLDTTWQGMPMEEQARRLDWEQPVHEGYVRWPAPKVAKPPPEEGSETPEAPAPTEPAPTEPAPTEPPKGAAPPPPPQAYEPPSAFEVPELSKLAKKKADAIVEAMRDHYRRATATYAEAQEARRAGAHDLFQEKLAEVRAILGTIQDMWNEELNKLMPGKRIEDREMTAEHYYGGILDEIYELKAIVRKLGSSR